MNYDKIEFQTINEDRLEMFRKRYPSTELRSFMDWKSKGKFVKKGETQKAYGLVVQRGYWNNPTTGEMEPNAVKVNVYGFTQSQVS